MAGCGDPGGEQSEEYCGADNARTCDESELDERDIALIQTGEPAHWILEQIQPVLNQQQCRSAPEEAVPAAGTKERSANESIARANQLGDLDLISTIFDIESNRIADDDDNGNAQQRRTDSDSLSHDIEDGVKPLDPFRINLHERRLREVADFFL